MHVTLDIRDRADEPGLVQIEPDEQTPGKFNILGNGGHRMLHFSDIKNAETIRICSYAGRWNCQLTSCKRIEIVDSALDIGFITKPIDELVIEGSIITLDRNKPIPPAHPLKFDDDGDDDATSDVAGNAIQKKDGQIVVVSTDDDKRERNVRQISVKSLRLVDATGEFHDMFNSLCDVSGNVIELFPSYASAYYVEEGDDPDAGISVSRMGDILASHGFICAEVFNVHVQNIHDAYRLLNMKNDHPMLSGKIFRTKWCTGLSEELKNMFARAMDTEATPLALTDHIYDIVRDDNTGVLLFSENSSRPETSEQVRDFKSRDIIIQNVRSRETYLSFSAIPKGARLTVANSILCVQDINQDGYDELRLENCILIVTGAKCSGKTLIVKNCAIKTSDADENADTNNEASIERLMIAFRTHMKFDRVEVDNVDFIPYMARSVIRADGYFDLDEARSIFETRPLCNFLHLVLDGSSESLGKFGRLAKDHPDLDWMAMVDHAYCIPTRGKAVSNADTLVVRSRAMTLDTNGVESGKLRRVLYEIVKRIVPDITQYAKQIVEDTSNENKGDETQPTGIVPVRQETLVQVHQYDAYVANVKNYLYMDYDHADAAFGGQTPVRANESAFDWVRGSFGIDILENGEDTITRRVSVRHAEAHTMTASMLSAVISGKSITCRLFNLRGYIPIKPSLPPGIDRLEIYDSIVDLDSGSIPRHVDHLIMHRCVFVGKWEHPMSVRCLEIRKSDFMTKLTEEQRARMRVYFDGVTSAVCDFEGFVPENAVSIIRPGRPFKLSSVMNLLRFFKSCRYTNVLILTQADEEELCALLEERRYQLDPRMAFDCPTMSSKGKARISKLLTGH